MFVVGLLLATSPLALGLVSICLHKVHIRRPPPGLFFLSFLHQHRHAPSFHQASSHNKKISSSLVYKEQPTPIYLQAGITTLFTFFSTLLLLLIFQLPLLL
ncbi:hypothetical protein L873DRAFT_971106 [Choiromyces venosus 120613-1]|uniref:Uncharacterized protein n=1 Tax=Choiromyces venosus 120613-1 TaxID=1336337 RepID=A0A3N4JSC3_9PEZI|nr:hypothetical protein L873DRAFT_971106 [Choiromyces venosus 120613-1]